MTDQFLFQRISGLEDLQSQINQLKILTGANLKLTSVPNSQLEDIDTGLGWDDLGSYGTTTGTPSTAFHNDPSRQYISDGYKQKPEPIREATREESPYATKGGLKNMNIPSPTPKTAHNEPIISPEPEKDKINTDRRTPGDVTPDGWGTPQDEAQSPENMRAGHKSTMTDGIPTPRNKSRSQSRKGRNSQQKTGRESQGPDTGRGSLGNESPVNQTKSPINQTQSPVNQTQSPTNQTQSPGNQTPGGTKKSVKEGDTES